MTNGFRLALWGWAGVLTLGSLAHGQGKLYIGYAYPAGGRQGTTVSVKLGGQGLNDVDGARVTGTGVTAKVVDVFRQIGNQEQQVLREQLKELKPNPKKPPVKTDAVSARITDRVEKRLDAYVNRPACASIAALVFIDVTIAPDAPPGVRELRLTAPGAVSNPIPFHVGQVPECARKPLRTCEFQVLGKEELALRKRPDDEVEQRLTLPCTANGQIAPGEVNVYRFEARKGQRLVLSTAARQLVPYLADAVPGWFQPVLAVTDTRGNELAYNDDFRFKPDPALCFEVPKDGEYLFTLSDAIYRGREDFVYRVTVGELPYVTSVFPLGGPAGTVGKVALKGWNLEGARPVLPPADAAPGIHSVAAVKDGFVSNRVPFALDTLPECLEAEPNNVPSTAQRVTLPVIVNGRMDRAKDEDVFRIEGRLGDTLVTEVVARRLDSPLDSVLKVTDAAGALLAFNDDHLDPEAGINTHHADSCLTVKLPADGTYFIHLTDTARQGGEAYAYRLRLSAPQPDFALRVVPSSVTLRSKGSASLTVYAIRTDGFTGDIKLSLKDPPKGFEGAAVTLPASKESTRITVKTTLKDMPKPVILVVEGRAKIGDREVVHEAVPAEDRMQAFLWRHLVPAEDLVAAVFDPSSKPPPARIPPPPPAVKKEVAVASASEDGMMEMAATSKTATTDDGMQEMAPAKAAASPVAGKENKPASAAPAPPSAGKEAKTTSPAAGKQDKPSTPAPPASGKADKPAAATATPPKPTPAPAAPAAAGKTDKPAAATATPPKAPERPKPKFTKKQVEWRLRQLKALYEDWLMTDAFYLRKVAECEAEGEK